MKTLRARIITQPTTTLAQLRQQFLAEKRGSGCTPKTIDYYDKVWVKLLRFIPTMYPDKDVMTLPMTCLAVKDLQSRYRVFIEDGGCGEQTILSHMRGLRCILKFAATIGLSGAPKIKVKNIDPPIKITYTESELDTLSRKPRVHDFLMYRAWIIARFTMATSCRAGSIAGIMVQDVDLDTGFVSINIVKNRNPIILPLVSSIIKELREYIALYRTSEDGIVMLKEPLFTTEFGEQLSADAVGRIFREYCDKLGIEKRSIHLLRHTYAKKYITTGGDILSLKAMLGHRSLKMVNHYANLYGSDIKDLVEEHALISQTKIRSGRKKIKAIK